MNNSFTKSIELVFQMLMSHLYGGGSENSNATVSDMIEVREHLTKSIDQSCTWNTGDSVHESLILLINSTDGLLILIGQLV